MRKFPTQDRTEVRQSGSEKRIDFGIGLSESYTIQKKKYGTQSEILPALHQDPPLLSTSTVTGPSLTSSTSIIARKTPVATLSSPRDNLNIRTKCW